MWGKVLKDEGGLSLATVDARKGRFKNIAALRRYLEAGTGYAATSTTCGEICIHCGSEHRIIVKEMKCGGGLTSMFPAYCARCYGKSTAY